MQTRGEAEVEGGHRRQGGQSCGEDGDDNEEEGLERQERPSPSGRIKLRGSSRIVEKTQAIVAKIKDKVTELQFLDITDPHLVKSIACCIQSVCNRKNKKHPINKHEILCQVLEAIKKSPLTPDERATVLVLAKFCLDNGLVRGVPLWRLVIQNSKAMDILTRIADAEAAEKADREERAAEYFRQFEADLDEVEDFFSTD
ncbi:hypothetical protein B484DRAFT_409573 [Ochromonadaceae sp. CCMP2298]|nr:hypothetical protein B484DRAFT_409573 [Ochromonadaceae sp. CCMP2298]